MNLDISLVAYIAAGGLLLIGTAGIVLSQHVLRIIFGIALLESGANLLLLLSSFHPQAVAPIVVDCKGEEDCLQCLRPLEQELGELLRLFERLRVIYADYKSTYDTAVTIGDSLAGLHGAAGAAWAQIKVGMQVSLRNLQGAYDAKFNEFMGRYAALLQRADRCLPEGIPPVSNSVSARSMKALLAIQYKRSG